MGHELQTCYLSIKNVHFKQFWILISQYNYKTLRAPWEIMQKKKDEPKSKLNGIKES